MRGLPRSVVGNQVDALRVNVIEDVHRMITDHDSQFPDPTATPLELRFFLYTVDGELQPSFSCWKVESYSSSIAEHDPWWNYDG